MKNVHIFTPVTQEQITQSFLCISTTGSKDLEKSDTKFDLDWRLPPFSLNIKYSVPHENR